MCTSFYPSNFSAHPWFKLAIKTSYTDLFILWPTAILGIYYESSLALTLATDNSNFSIENRMAKEVMSALGNYWMCEIVTHPTALQYSAPICAPGHEFKGNQLIRVACFSPVQFRNRESRRIWFLSRLCFVSFIFPAVVFHFSPQYKFKLIIGLLSDDSYVLFSIGTDTQMRFNGNLSPEESVINTL